MIRVFNLVSNLRESSRLISVIMHYYRCIDKSKVQFDFLNFKELDDNTYKSEFEN